MSEAVKKKIEPLPRVARAIGVPVTTMRRKGNEGGFPIYKIGNRDYVDVSEVNRWIESTAKASA